jgi:ribosomal protein L29
MNLRMEMARHILGRTILDEYGATIGKIVGISTDVRCQVTSVEVELGNGQFLNCSPAQVIISEQEIRLLDDWKVEAESLNKEFDLAIKRMNALSDLHRQGDIQPDIYEDFHRNHDANLNELETRREDLKKKLVQVRSRLDQQIRELETFLATNKMQLASGEIDPQAYKIAADSIENGLKRTFSAKTEIETILTGMASTGKIRTEKQPQKILEKTISPQTALNVTKLLPPKFDTQDF